MALCTGSAISITAISSLLSAFICSWASWPGLDPPLAAERLGSEGVDAEELDVEAFDVEADVLSFLNSDATVRGVVEFAGAVFDVAAEYEAVRDADETFTALAHSTIAAKSLQSLSDAE